MSESGEKMSKSLGNFLDPEAIDNYVAQFGLDALRYFLATRGPLGTTDSAFSPDLFIETYNSDLANTFGNSCSRVTNMIGKYFQGTLPACQDAGTSTDLPRCNAETLVNEFASDMAQGHWAVMTAMNLAGAANSAMFIVREVDSYIEQSKPFSRAKDPDKLPEVGTILYNCAEALRCASVLLWPFLPDQCEAFWRRIGAGHYADQLKNKGRGDLGAWAQWGQLKPGTPIQKGEALFPRYQAEKK